jgi:hypothetical protein
MTFFRAEMTVKFEVEWGPAGRLPEPGEFRPHAQTLRNMLACWARRLICPRGVHNRETFEVFSA